MHIRLVDDAVVMIGQVRVDVTLCTLFLYVKLPALSRCTVAGHDVSCFDCRMKNLFSPWNSNRADVFSSCRCAQNTVELCGTTRISHNACQEI